jgi:hypothetical protein
VKPGTATADNPFVLGYGLAQKVPDLKQIDPKLETDKTPKYFIPRAYQITTTPGFLYEKNSTTPKNSPYSNGTLNFCILTFRDDSDRGSLRPANKVDLKQNANAGKLAMSPFDLTKTSAQDSDGMMCFARDLFFDRFLVGMIRDAYFIDPDTLLPKGGDVTMSSSKMEESPSNDPPRWTREKKFSVNGKKTNTFFDDKSTTEGE